jgi:hypothetical protein
MSHLFLYPFTGIKYRISKNKNEKILLKNMQNKYGA